MCDWEHQQLGFYSLVSAARFTKFRICMFTGLLVVHTGRESIKFGPPLTISDDALLEGLSIFSDAVAQAIAEKYDWGV